MPPSSANGTLLVDGDHASFRFVRRLAHPVDVVWAALTDPDERAEWFGPSVVEAREGGIVETDPRDPPVPAAAKHMRGRILVWQPPHVLEHEWHQPIVEDSVVRYELEADGDETVLTFTHSGLSARNARGFIPGTHAFLDMLAAYLDGTPLPRWQERFDEVAPDYA